MTIYRIRGRIILVSRNNQPSPNLWVEIWDKDERFDDRLGRSKTDFDGIFEVEFTDIAFQQEVQEQDFNPDIFFRVYQGRQLLFDTGNVENGIRWNSSDFSEFQVIQRPLEYNPIWQVSVTVPDNQENDDTISFNRLTFRIEVLNAWIIPETVDREPSTIDIPEDLWENQVIDVLPTLDQVERSGFLSAITPSQTQGGNLQQIVDHALSQVLCRTPKNDAKAFLSSLSKAFTPEENNGRTRYNWTPCSYNTTQTELGGSISGAQASLYHRAKAALNEMLPLLERLHPLNSSADTQNTEAVRSIVRTEIIELVNELGTQGGPRVQRVDSLFQLLIGEITADDPYEIVGGQLRELADIFGLTRAHVNTVEEEQNYSNYLIIRDYLVSLRGSWRTYIENSGAGAFVGSQLVLLSQALSVVSESVQEVYRIMDLVFLGASERQSVWIDFTKTQVKLSNNEFLAAGTFPLPDGKLYKNGLQLTPAMTIESLLSWAMRFATQEGPMLARSGGKIGIAQSLKGTADRLMILVQAASFVPVQNTAYRRAGVTRSLKDLAFQLYQVKRLAEELIPPITSGRFLDADDERDNRRQLRSNDSLPGREF